MPWRRLSSLKATTTKVHRSRTRRPERAAVDGWVPEIAFPPHTGQALPSRECLTEKDLCRAKEKTVKNLRSPIPRRCPHPRDPPFAERQGGRKIPKRPQPGQALFIFGNYVETCDWRHIPTFPLKH